MTKPSQEEIAVLLKAVLLKASSLDLDALRAAGIEVELPLEIILRAAEELKAHGFELEGNR